MCPKEKAYFMFAVWIWNNRRFVKKKQIQDIEMKTSPFLPILRLQQGWSPVVDFTQVHAGNLGDALTQVQGLKGGVGRLGRGFAPFL